jgi:hypothetical protein
MGSRPLAPAMFTWILDRACSGRENRKISTTQSVKDRASANGCDRDLPRDRGSFCQRPTVPPGRSGSG